MKIKTDHVTNSSSASFILRFVCPQCNDKEDFIENVLNPLIEYYEKEEMFGDDYKDIRFLSFKDVRETGNKQFEIEEWTSMMNSHDDISGFFKFIMILHAKGVLPNDFACHLEKFYIIDES